MAESPEEQFNRIRDAVQQSILKSYPNPNREGCPGEPVVREVAARDELTKDSSWEHITHCSPCYSEFLKYQDELRTAAPVDASRITRRVAMAGGGIVLAGVAAGVVWDQQYRVHVVDVDLEEQASFRSAGEPMQSRSSRIVLPNGRVRLRLVLAKNSESGIYGIQIWKSLEAPPLMQTSASSAFAVGRQHLEAEFQIRLAAGEYTLGVRNDHREAWRYFPLTVGG